MKNHKPGKGDDLILNLLLIFGFSACFYILYLGFTNIDATNRLLEDRYDPDVKENLKQHERN